MQVRSTVGQQLKAVDGVTMTPDELENQAHAVEQALCLVNPEAPGTCIDERERVGTLNGDTEIEPRHSVPGGPNIYALYMAELTAYFGQVDADSRSRLATVTTVINDAGVPSGGHIGCAANASFNVVIGLVGDGNVDAGRIYARDQLGADFDDEAYQEVVANAQSVAQGGRYVDWSEDVLLDVLGDQSGHAVEILGGQHEGRTFARVKAGNMTVDQTELHRVVGEDTFVNDDDYETRIENVIADGPQSEWKQKVARHAREALLAALFPALPNKELHQIDINVHL